MYVYISLSICMYIDIHLHIYIYICIYTHTCTYVCTHARGSRRAPPGQLRGFIHHTLISALYYIVCIRHSILISVLYSHQVNFALLLGFMISWVADSCVSVCCVCLCCFVVVVCICLLCLFVSVCLFVWLRDLLGRSVYM